MIAIFMAKMIIDEVYDYTYVILKRPTLRDGINDYLRSVDRGDLIPTTE